MRDRIKKGLLALAPLIDVCLAPFLLPASILLLLVRRFGVAQLPLSRRIFALVGVFPVRDHYYEPLVNPARLHKRLDALRMLPGLEWNEAGQLDLLSKLDIAGYAAELVGLPQGKTDQLEFHFGNGTFESGDAEFWYAMIRHHKPRRIIEIGSGNSTLMARRAIERNRQEDAALVCLHTCIEPYEMAWLERLGIDVVRSRVEEVGLSVFGELGENDILFIDSSHVIRPQGDVLCEFLQILPTLRPGVVVHVHDIFTPRDYLSDWVLRDHRLWNEQYLLEAFLCQNPRWKVLAGLNFLHHAFPKHLKSVCPYVQADREPGSFYMQRIGN